MSTRILVDGIGLPEGPRWRDGRLYYSDIQMQRVCVVDMRGEHRVLDDGGYAPSGIGWTPDGAMLVVSMQERRLVEVSNDAAATAADLSAMTSVACNDMLITPAGQCFVGTFASGSGETAVERIGSASPSPLLQVDLASGATTVAADGLVLPNGMCLTDDARLLVAETATQRILEFTVDDDGTLSGPSVWAELDFYPDGICLDADGFVWAASPIVRPGFHRVEHGGAVERSIECAAGRSGFACALGGPEGDELFLLEAPSPPVDPAAREGSISVVRAPAAAAGWM